MRVKIGEAIYDSENEPLMVILSAADKENIRNMMPEATCYASFPDCWGNDDKMRAWMLTPNGCLMTTPTNREQRRDLQRAKRKEAKEC